MERNPQDIRGESSPCDQPHAARRASGVCKTGPDLDIAAVGEGGDAGEGRDADRCGTDDEMTDAPDSEHYAHEEPDIYVLPPGRPESAMRTADFVEYARVVAEAARSTSLLVPAFRSPPRSPALDRSIIRRPSHTVVAVRRRGRPSSAVKADIIEGVVVANALDAVAAARFRDHAWAVLSTVDDVADKSTVTSDVHSGVEGKGRCDDSADRSSGDKQSAGPTHPAFVGEVVAA